MEIYYKKQRNIASLFTRFIIGFGAGLAGVLVLAIFFFLSQGIIGDFLTTSADEMTNDLGMSLGNIEPTSLHLILIALAVFVSVLVATIAHAFLNLLVDSHYTKRATTLTHIFYGNIVFLLFMLPVYVLTNIYFETTTSILYIAILHAFLTSFFSISVLQVLHQGKYVLVNLYGNFLGFLLFLFLSIMIFQSQDNIITAFLAFPLFLGLMAFGNRMLELIYAFLYTKSGIDMLSIDTTFGDDYGVPITEKEFNEDDEFEKEFKI
jgi:MFS family permease